MSSSSPRPVVTRRARPVFEGPTYKAPQYHSRIWGRLIFFLFVMLLAVVIFFGGGMYWLLHRPQSDSSQSVNVHVGAGDTVGSIASLLDDRGIISNTFLFKLDARIQGLSGKLKAGDYTIRRNMSIDGMVNALEKYRQTYVSFTIPEGWRAEQIAAGLQQDGFPGRTFLQDVRHPSPGLLKSLGASIVNDKPRGASLEGYLFPDTYHLAPGESADVIIKTMVDNLNTRFTPSMRTAVAAAHRSIYRTLTLASIVEREAAVPDERSIIAGIYVRRLTSAETDYKLQADPTVQYALGSSMPITISPDAVKKWWPELQDQAANIRPDSPYNTYTHQGWPPGPIADAGIASIKAAVHPKRTDYLYFVAVRGGHGHQVFAKTYQEQLANEQKYG